MSSLRELTEFGQLGDLPARIPSTSIAFPIASNVWVVNHDLGKRPSVTVIESTGHKIYGNVFYDSNNRTITITFLVPVSGTVELN